MNRITAPCNGEFHNWTEQDNNDLVAALAKLFSEQLAPQPRLFEMLWQKNSKDVTS